MIRFLFPYLYLGALAIGFDSLQPVRAATPRDEKPPAAIQITINSIGMKLVRIPPGEFLMGSPANDKNVRDDEKPQHLVRITNAFHFGMFEVTQEEYQRVLGKNPSFFSPTGPGKDRVRARKPARFPAEQVSWFDAVEFCRLLSNLPDEKRAGRGYRLPTEAEWEYACRAGTTSAFHGGDALSSTQANFNGNDPFGDARPGPFLLRTTEVGSYSPNAFKLYDMHGNVWEWCADWYAADYYKRSPTNDPPGPRTGSARVIRGGGWRTEGNGCRSAFRNADMPTGRYYVTGFRVVMTRVDSSARNLLTAPVKPAPARPPSSPALAVLTAADRALLFQGEDWPRWRGPRGDGTWHGPKLPGHWASAGLRCLWRQRIGGGFAGIVMAGGRVYTMDHHQPPDEAESVLCFDAVTGKPIWTYSYPVKYGNLEYGNGPRATPTIADGRIYTLGALGNLHCLDAATGKLLWSTDLVRDHQARVPLWGCAASPVVFENLLIVHAGAQPNASLLAFDRRTGKEAWRNLPDEAGYATPILIESHGTPQLVCWTPTNVRGLDPRSGKLYWTVPFEVTYGTSIATPTFQDGVVLVSGYWEGSKAIHVGAAPTDARVLWQERRNLRALMSQPLYRNGHAYLLDKHYGLTCFELKTGKKLWDDNNRMTPKGRNPQATMVWVGDADRAIVLNSDGDLILARLNPSGYQEESRTNIISPTWSHPAYAGGCVYARNDSELVCVALISPRLGVEPPQP